MFSEQLINFSRSAWKQAFITLGSFGRKLAEQLANTSGDERVLLELALGTLPASDLASVSFEVLQAYAQHALLLRRSSPFCKDIPEDIFIHCVYYPRINSEDLVDCRSFFYDKLLSIVKGKTAKEAALAVNRWCAAQMTYEMTDTRSINPLTAYFCGLGRCGEESTFCVTALRSIGLPARQIYVPWWSHCDDNHAWVEVYTGDGWHFLGACEPELTLDRGWFLNASSRAMVVCSRNFFSFVGDGLKQENLVDKKGICLSYNQICRYADFALITVKVVDKNGNPIIDAWVRFYVENMAQFACIAALQTDSQGCVQLESGLGSCLIEVEAYGLFEWTAIQLNRAITLTLTPNKSAPDIDTVQWDFSAPETCHKRTVLLSAKEQNEKSLILRQAKDLRLTRIQGYWSSEYETDDWELNQVFHIAGGHASALWQFYKRYGDDARTLLLSLPYKDWRDADPDVLSAHLEALRSFPNRDDPNFVPYVQCPRIGFELLTDWRSSIQAFLSQEQKETFRKNPVAAWHWVQENFQPGMHRWHPVLWLQPDAALKLGAADLRGQRLLFVAILRTLGIASRLDPIDGRAQYFCNHCFHTVEDDNPVEPSAILHIAADSSMEYSQSWGLSRWLNGWHPLALEEQNLFKVSLPLGLYCLHTVNRLPSGNQLIQLNTFQLNRDQTILVKKRAASPQQLLSNYPVVLPVSVSRLELQFYLDCGTEPTEHILNELLTSQERVKEIMQQDFSLRFLLPRSEDLQDATLKKVLCALPKICVQQLDFSSGVLETLARSLYLEPGLWPLITLTDGKSSYYANAGYSVGSLNLALNLAQLKQSQLQ